MLVHLVLCCAPGPVSFGSESVETCCDGAGACLPVALLEPDEAAQLAQANCPASSVCVPNELQRMQPPATCGAAGGGEGRCLPTCLPQVRDQASQLPQAQCNDQQRCVPCYDPLTGVSTGACNLAGDPGPIGPPHVFDWCCQNSGRCIPEDLLAEKDRAQFGPDNCKQSGMLCVPRNILVDPDGFVPKTCSIESLNAEGRCLAECMPEIAGRLDRLTRETCAAGERCVPCFDPITAESTGACESARDPGPKSPPPVIASCCNDRGRCVTSDRLSAAQAKSLGPDACTADELCVPLPFLNDPEFTPEACTVAEIAAEGRCLPECLPQLMATAARLGSATCHSGDVCAPCFDPVTGASTGSCDLGRDRGPTGAPVVLEHCCGGRGRCAPKAWIPENYAASLGPDTCAGAELCVAPEAALADDNYRPATCKDDVLGVEGRCLPDCMPAVKARAAQLRRALCEKGELCVPCFDPVSGEQTGACNTGRDEPREDPRKLATCCNGAGRCAPAELVPEAYASSFGPDTCSTSRELCVAPQAALSDAAYKPATCRDELLNTEGRCLPTCLPTVAARSRQLRRAQCASGELCVPCFDPISGEATGACTGPNDTGPSSTPATFEPCCSSGGRAAGLCVPSALLPEGAPALPRDTCTKADRVCAPRILLGSDERPASCATLLSGPGVCLDACFLGSQSALLTVSTCEAQERCVPCSAAGAVDGC
ncbi:MAG TPA: hypothetical protein VJR89_03070 [Polyangiales bacterium]|nr:hypothetical protein [Polyangiales bacterium]